MCPPTGSCDCKAASPHCLEHSHETRRPVQRLRARLRVVVRLAMTRSVASSARRSLAVVSVLGGGGAARPRSEEHTSELQSLMRISYAVFCLKKKNNIKKIHKQIKFQSQHAN